MRWLAAQQPDGLFTTTITQAEILLGLALMPHGRRSKSHAQLAHEILNLDFAGRILPFDSQAAETYAIIASERRNRGRPIATFDAQIASIARSHNAELATRNVADFDACGVKVVNPWAG